MGIWRASEWISAGEEKITRWTLSDKLSLVGGPAEHEMGDVAHGLKDLVDLHNVSKLSSDGIIKGEERPDV